MTLRMQRFLVVTLAALLALPALALGQPPAAPGDGSGFGPGRGGPGAHALRAAHRRPGGPGPFHNLDFVADLLDLTEEQREQAAGLRDGLRESHRVLRQESRTLRQELRAALNAEAPDTGHIGELTLALHEQRQRGRALAEQALADFEALLTAEKLETFQQLRRSLRERRQERREDWRQRWEERSGTSAPNR